VTWHRHLFYRKESWKTTWKLKLSVAALVVVGVAGSRVFLAERLAQSLVCVENSPPSDALLLENFDPVYLVFERAQALREAGIASRVFVPVIIEDADIRNSVGKGFVEVMSRIARLPETDIIPVHQEEPISLNAAQQIKDFLLKKHIKSIVVVAPAYRSRRSELVYGAVLRPAGIAVGCVPVFGTTEVGNWTQTWHGIQEVAEQFAKLQYYRLYVLR
jgi:uncharacterized SAM-binding protein YcdF (DUF218 family)